MGVTVLGAIFAILSAASFALNNAAARRAVVTGTPTQGMALTVPIGVLCFLLVAALTGELTRLAQFPAGAIAWMIPAHAVPWPETSAGRSSCLMW